MNFMFVFILLQILLVSFGHAQSTDCVYDLSNPKNRPSKMPFILDPKSMKHYTLINNELRIPLHKSVLLKCDFYDESNSLTINALPDTLFNCSSNKNLVYKNGYYDAAINFNMANCKKSNFFLHNYQYKEDKCKTGIKIAISYAENRISNENGTEEKVVLDLIGICFDNKTSSPIYTHIKMSNEPADKHLSTIGKYIDLNEFVMDIEELYEEYYIPTNMDYLMDINYMNWHLNNISDNNMFIDGHRMIPVQLVNENHMALMLNEAYNSSLIRIPMWEILSKGNWNNLQKDIRLLISSPVEYRTIDIYAGTHGILTLTDRNGLPTPLYLLNDIHYGRVLPVPKYVWNVIYSHEEKKAVAIVAYNNPYAINITESIFCKDVCDQLLWLNNLDPRKILSGPIFCCEFLDFRKTVDTIPFLNEGLVDLLIK